MTLPTERPDRPRRTPRPWWFRLIGWLAALAVLAGAVGITLARGSYSATTHTLAQPPRPADQTPPAQSVSPIGSFDTSDQLAGPVVADLQPGGVIGRDPASGEEIWRYMREDSKTCAHHATADRIVLVYPTGDRCDQAISLSPGSGARQWQRTIEAHSANEIIWTDGGFISLDPRKMISYEINQGFERFTVDTTTGQTASVEMSQCEHLDAAGHASVVTLQRCRADADSPWQEQLIVNVESDGKPREVGRTFLSGDGELDLVDATQDGTAFLRATDGVILAVPPAAQTAVPIPGLPPMSEQTRLIMTRGSVVLTDPQVTAGLGPDLASVAWSTPGVAPASYSVTSLYVPTAAGIEVRAADDGALLRTIALPEPLPAGAELTVHGPLVAIRDEPSLTVLR